MLKLTWLLGLALLSDAALGAESTIVNLKCEINRPDGRQHEILEITLNEGAGLVSVTRVNVAEHTWSNLPANFSQDKVRWSLYEDNKSEIDRTTLVMLSKVFSDGVELSSNRQTGQCDLLKPIDRVF